MLVAIDIGNTNILIGIINSEGLIQNQHRISTVDLLNKEKSTLIELDNIFNDLNSISDYNFIIASVVPEACNHLNHILKEINVSANILSSTDKVLGMKIDIDKPSELGTDRIVNAIAAVDEYKAPLVVIDFGTATTFDIIDSDGTYKGGLICPGIKLSIKSLNSDTAQLPLVDLKRTSTVIGRDTKSAIESGIYWGYVSLVEGLIEKIQSEMGLEECTVVGTGGLSHIFREDIKKINYFNDDLTLKGLYSINKKINGK
jgi:type III pantothenate kinase